MMMTTIAFIFSIVLFAIGIGFAVAAIIYIPIIIYIAPYEMWIGYQNSIGKYLDAAGSGAPIRRHLQDATKVYRHWFTGKELQF